ncbi:LemA family protein [soil metagenome]
MNALVQSGSVTTRRHFGRTALLVALPLTMGLAGCGVNSIPTQDEAVKKAWGDVQNQYQRRSDLIPNLVATVQGYAAQERGTLTDVINARAKATAVNVDASTINDPAKLQQFQQAQEQLSGSLGRLLVVTENYPDLKSNQNFLALQSQLEGTENRITVARNDYNGAVQTYNTTLRVFPTVLWAKTLYASQKAATPFAASTAAQSAPTVNFNIPSANSAMPGGGTTRSTSSTTTTTTAPAK